MGLLEPNNSVYYKCALYLKGSTMKASILDLRRHMGEVLKALDRNEIVTLTYRGHEKATIVPKKATGKISIKKHPAFGLWEIPGNVR